MLAQLKNANETGTFATFRSGATTLSPTDTTRPYITMAYVNNDGLEPYWDYQSASAGRAGTVHANYFTGALTGFIYDKDGKLTTLTSAGGSLTKYSPIWLAAEFETINYKYIPKNKRLPSTLDE